MATAAGAVRQKQGRQTLLNIRDLHEVIQLLEKHHFTTARYYPLGLSLGLSYNTLKVIEKDYKGDTDRCLSETLGEWLRKADNVGSKGDPSYHTLAVLIAALRAIGENAVADGIDREKHPACVILANHQSDQSLQDSLPSLVLLLHKEGITREILPATGGTKAILTAVRVAVCLDHKNLKKFAAILQLFPTTVLVGDAIMKDYREEFTDGIIEVMQATDGEENKYLEAAMKDGTVKSRITKAVVQGEARAGKTSLKCLLLSQSYKKPSTSCVEVSQVAYGSFSVNRFGRTGKHWTLVDDDEMSDKVLVELKLISEIRKDAIFTNSSLDELVHSDRPDGDITIPHSVTTKTNDLVPLQPSSSGTDITGDSSEVNHTEPIAEVKELYEQCKEIQKEEGISLHQEWLYFVDTGGQIQFQKLLPAFMPFASVLILVLNLARSLSEKASTEMQLEHDQQISVSEHSLTVEEILKQLLSAIALSTEHFDSLIVKDPILSRCIEPPEEKLNVIAVATHGDEYRQLVKEERVESLQVKEEKLKQIFDSMKQKCTIVRSDPLNILYEVDGSKASRGEFDDPIVDQISDKLNNQAYEVNVPIKWYCFSILLRKIAKEGCGVLSVSYCQTLGEQLGLPEGEVKSVLHFLHILNMLLYYPDSPVDDMVFVIVDSLVDIIRELVVLVCTARDKGMSVDDDVYKLATEGLLSIKVLKCSKKFCRISQFFNEFGQKLLYLFQHLLIAVPIQEKSIKFFMPALLPVKDVLNTSPFPNKTSTPLLFFFKSAVPMGLFCAFIVHLLSDRQLPATSDYESSNSSLEDDEKIAATSSSSRWRIIKTKESNWSNYFTIQNTSMKGVFVFVERLECIEVHAEYPKAQATKSIKKAIKDTLEIRGLIKEKAKKAFYCNCSFNKGLRHVAVVRTCKNDHKYVLRCTLSNKDVDLDEETSSWLNKTDGKVKNTSSSAPPQSSDSSQVPHAPQSSGSSSAPPQSSGSSQMPPQSSGSSQMPPQSSGSSQVSYGNEEVDSSASVFLQCRLNEEPDIHELLNQLSSIAHQWKEIGLGLKVNGSDLESAKNEQSDQLRLNHVLECWKKNMSPPYTWITILDVISGPMIKNKRLRDAIEQWLLGTEKVSETLSHTVLSTQSNDIKLSSESTEGSTASAVHDSTNEIEEVDSSQQGSILEQNKKLLKDYTVDQMYHLLEKIDLEKYKEVFKKMEVNGRTFFRLTDDDLKDPEQFNMGNKFHRRIVMGIVKGDELLDM